ncbi:MAG TPA: DUF5777 family beta-barrel protein [Thermoanaerobaculia bacterium]|nr:DUF5777 family beta-barrel protein [Thermoanaerobaculia bacterium]
MEARPVALAAGGWRTVLPVISILMALSTPAGAAARQAAAGEAERAASEPVPQPAPAGSAAGESAATPAAEQGPTPGAPGQDEVASRDPVGARLIDVPAPYTVGRHKLELLFTHRFVQPVNQGSSHNLWGLDSAADVGIGLAFGVTRRLDLSAYRSSFEEDFELAAKLMLVDQAPRIPVAIAVRAGADLLGRQGIAAPHRPFAQLLLASHFARGVSLFVSPTYVRDTPLLRNAFNVPIGATMPLPARLLLEVEAIPPVHRLKQGSLFAWHAALMRALGGHIFQIVVGNSRATTVDQYVGGDAASGFARSDVRLGFNLVRYFPG